MGTIFLTVYALLNLAYFSLPDAQLKQIHELLVLRPCSAILNTWLGVGAVIVSDHGLVSEGIYLAVVRGCDGAGVLFLLLAAVACFPARPAAKLVGMLAGLVLVQVLNVARIATLFLVFKDHRASFPDLHNLYLPTAMLLICGLAFMLWTNGVPLRERTP